MCVKGVYCIETGNPNGFILTAGPAICYTVDGAMWIKTDLGYGNTGWVKRIDAIGA